MLLLNLIFYESQVPFAIRWPLQATLAAQHFKRRPISMTKYSQTFRPSDSKTRHTWCDAVNELSWKHADWNAQTKLRVDVCWRKMLTRIKASVAVNEAVDCLLVIRGNARLDVYAIMLFQTFVTVYYCLLSRNYYEVSETFMWIQISWNFSL